MATIEPDLIKDLARRASSDLDDGDGDKTTVIVSLNELGDKSGQEPRVPILRISRGTETGRHFILRDQQNFNIGRSNECFIVTPDASCSRKHAEFFLASSGDVFVKDLGSTNGTAVNGVRITAPKLLEVNDLIQVGDNTEFVYEQMRKSEAEAQVEIYEKATRDALTGIYNRQFFEDNIIAIIKRRNAEQSGMGLIIFDIDHFKKVNDTYGHPVGDAVIKEVGRRIPTMIRGDDIFARIGGEEFAIMLRTNDEALVAKMTERIRKVIEATPFHTDKGDLPIRISVGSAFVVGPKKIDYPTLYEATDKALYEAKQSGRNQSKNKIIS